MHIIQFWDVHLQRCRYQEYEPGLFIAFRGPRQLSVRFHHTSLEKQFLNTVAAIVEHRHSDQHQYVIPGLRNLFGHGNVLCTSPPVSLDKQGMALWDGRVNYSIHCF